MGRLIENAVGGHLLNRLQGLPYEVTYWRRGNSEVDCVVSAGPDLWAVEVKRGRAGAGPGLTAFLKAHPETRPLIFGTGGLPVEDFFTSDPRQLFS